MFRYILITALIAVVAFEAEAQRGGGGRSRSSSSSRRSSSYRSSSWGSSSYGNSTHGGSSQSLGWESIPIIGLVGGGIGVAIYFGAKQE